MSGGLIVLVNWNNYFFCLLPCRISYCTADKTQDKVFAYVSQSQFNETLECHAFLCQKKKIVSCICDVTVLSLMYWKHADLHDRRFV